MGEAREIPPDVRMRGFSNRTPVAAIWAWLEEAAGPLPAETISLAEAHRRILAEPVVATEAVPPFARAAMDGFALRGRETVGAGAYNPLVFPVAGESLPGAPFTGPLPPASAVRIMTGAPLPEGADAVAPAEIAREAEGRAEVTAAVPPRKHVGAVGEDIQAGATLLAAGHQLRPQDLGLLASTGRSEVAVVARPRVRLLVTGEEVVAPGGVRGPAQVFDANTHMLAALVERDGGLLEAADRVGDDPQGIGDLLNRGSAHAVLVTGGSSVGAEDHAPRLLAECGELAFHGVAMRPAAPTGVGRIGGALVFLLPGNPVACLAGYDFFAGRAIRQRGGRPGDWPHASVRRPLARKVTSEIGRTDYCRVALGAAGVEPIASSGASILSSTTRADGFVIVPADSEGYAPGTEVTVRLYRSGD